MQPNNENIAPVNDKPSDDVVVFRDVPKKKTGLVVGVVTLAVLAASGIGFGIWAVVSKNQEVADLKSQISSGVNIQQNNQLDKEEDPIIDTTPSINTADYIYVGEWGIKIKTPEELKVTGYKFVKNAVYGDILEFILEFFGDNTECVGELLKSNSEDGIFPYGSLVYTDNIGNKYYYVSPNSDPLNVSESDLNSWNESVAIVKTMLTEPSNYSSI